MSENRDNGVNKTVINWFPGHMVKALNDIKQSLKFTDIVCIILDARIPYASNNKQLFDIIKQKTVIIVLNKCDLADEENLRKAEVYYKKQGCYTLRTIASDSQGIKQLEELIIDLGSKIKNRKSTEKTSILKPSYRVMIVGIPNVGKSTIINKLANKKKVEVGNKPGVTKSTQWIKVTKSIDLLDTPGVLWPDLKEDLAGVKLAATGNIKMEIYDAEIVALEIIKYMLTVDRYRNTLKARFVLDDIDIESESQTLEKIGRRRGTLLAGGEINTELAAVKFLDEYRSGKIGRISLE